MYKTRFHIKRFDEYAKYRVIFVLVRSRDFPNPW